MAKQADFDAFLKNIEPSATTVSYISSIHTNLRSYLKNHESYKDIHIDTFLSGSYAKHTSIRPASGDKKRDVDIIVVTAYSSSKSSIDVLNELRDVLAEKSDYSSAEVQHHSVGIDMSGISIDVVPVIVDETDDQLYYIGDSEFGDWTLTDPKGHKAWSTEVNKENNDEYKHLVKIFKWWRRTNCPTDRKYPKGITLEKIIADNLGDCTLSTEDFFIATMQNIISAYKEGYVARGINPVINDPSAKVTENDLLSSYSVDDFSAFIEKIEEHINLLNTEGTTNDTWRTILGSEFPKGDSSNNSIALSNLQMCITAPHRQRLIWPVQRGGAAFIAVYVTNPNGVQIEYTNNGLPLEKGCSLLFKALTGIKPPYSVKWQIVNTGIEAQRANCLRGGFEDSDVGTNGRHEATAYSGAHSVQCFIIKRGICVAKSQEFIINIQ
ncbi:SMODS domain-containing nucleotidyltransferase [uncultured Dysosmobacter sp.]|uniref:SMODS domain-containing nucleotidyltransferase n=1 Tax=uncultured Dysosmobacter sp. TaxID=2591384 RepID=UPI00262C7357|nr:hypothetical protein [uncultured Dysosmobacter sp.]